MSYPLSSLLASMNGKTVTFDWDAVVAYDMATVNTMFAQQYVENVKTNANFPPVSATVAIPNSAITVKISGLMLGPPLISFENASLTSPTATVTMNFVAGGLLTLEQAGSVQYATAYQAIVPGDNLALKMTVDLTQVDGEVNQKVVTLDLHNAGNFQANLIGTTNAAALGLYFQDLFKATPAELSYQLGTLVFGSSDNLIPTSFDIYTQPAPGGDGDGAVVLFVATTYNENSGGKPDSSLPYLIPDTYSSAVVVASNTLLGNIVLPYLQQNLVGNPTLSVARIGDASSASVLSFTGGQVTTSNYLKYTWSSGVNTYQIWSGHPGDWRNFNPDYENPAVPFNGLTLVPENDLLTISWSHSFDTPFALLTSNKFGVSSANESLTVTVQANLSSQITVASTDVVTFAGTGTPSVSFSSSSWVSKWLGSGNQRDVAGNLITSALQPVADAILNVPLPQVNTFALAQLLFPQSNTFNFQNGYMPGDLLIVGTIAQVDTAFAISPLQTVIASGETQQFTSTLADVRWGRYPIGRISQSGLYTAPTVAAATPVTITATTGAGETTTAVVVIVPAPVTTASPFIMVVPNQSPFMIEANLLGNPGVPSWSMVPNDGSCGSVNPWNGTYTPPASLPDGVAFATVTIAAGSYGADTLLCLVNAPFVFSIAPSFAPLLPNATQQFSATIKQKPASVQWSISPQIGSISASGVYVAPNIVTQQAPVVVVAEDTDGLGVVGIALIMLTPLPPS